MGKLISAVTSTVAGSGANGFVQTAKVTVAESAGAGAGVGVGASLATTSRKVATSSVGDVSSKPLKVGSASDIEPGTGRFKGVSRKPSERSYDKVTEWVNKHFDPPALDKTPKPPAGKGSGTAHEMIREYPKNSGTKTSSSRAPASVTPGSKGQWVAVISDQKKYDELTAYMNRHKKNPEEYYGTKEQIDSLVTWVRRS